jgi:hypothetical protein
VTPPIFVVGCHRSGTTLLRFILDTHPLVACPPESKFIAGLAAAFNYPQALDGLFALGVSEDMYLAELRGIVERSMGRYLASRGKERWVDKTPNYYRILPFIDRLFGREAFSSCSSGTLSMSCSSSQSLTRPDAAYSTRQALKGVGLRVS